MMWFFSISNNASSNANLVLEAPVLKTVEEKEVFPATFPITLE